LGENQWGNIIMTSTISCANAAQPRVNLTVCAVRTFAQKQAWALNEQLLEQKRRQVTPSLAVAADVLFNY